MDSTVHSHSTNSVYETITDSIILAIEQGASDFVMPWHGGGAAVGKPTNALTGATYRGINVVALWAEACVRGYGSGHWATYRQWASLGAQVRRGEQASTIVFYKKLETSEPEDGEDVNGRLVARASPVFNAEQVDGWVLDMPLQVSLVERINAVDRSVAQIGADIREGGSVACYVPPEDYIRMPAAVRFLGSPTSTPTETYYGTLLHELTHWTGAPHRLDRAFGKRFGDDAYAMEELVAELGAAFLCADFSISNEPRPDHAAYLSGWLSILDADKRAIFGAARLASEAATYLRVGAAPY